MKIGDTSAKSSSAQEMIEEEVTVFVGDTPKKIAKGHCQTEQLIDILGIEQDYLLNVKSPGDEALRQLMPGEILEITENMIFVPQVPCGASS